MEYVQEFVDRGPDRIGLQCYPDPEGVTDAPVAVILPAMGVPARFYRRFAGDLRRAGFAVVVAELRSTGTSTPGPSRASRHGYAELAEDVGAVLAALKPRLDGRTCLLVGHSLGGQTALLRLALADEPAVHGVVLVAVGLPYWRCYPSQRRWAVLASTQVIVGTARVLGIWPGWGFGGRQVRGVIRDWGYTARTGRFPRLDGVDVEAALGRVRTPVLAISVEHDALTPHGTITYLCAKLGAAPVRVERYDRAQAGVDRLDHFSWVRAAGPLAGRLAAFAATVADR